MAVPVQKSQQPGDAEHSAGAPAAPSPVAPPPVPSSPAIGRQARGVAALVTALGLAVLLWPRGSGTSLAAPGGFLLDPTGRAATLGARLTPVTLVHFWATWCPPCIEEAPGLERLARDFAADREFSLLRVAVADSRSRVDAFLGTGAASVLYDPQWDVAHRYGTDQLPETYLVVHGHIVEKFIGEVNWDDPTVRQKIASRLTGGTSGAAGNMAGSS